MEEYLIIHIRIPGALILHAGVLNTHSDHLLEIRNAPSASAQLLCKAALTAQVATFFQTRRTNLHSFVHLFIQFNKYLLTHYVSGSVLKHWGQNVNKRPKFLALMKLIVQYILRNGNIKMEPHFPVMSLLPISCSWLYFELIRTDNYYCQKNTTKQRFASSPKTPQTYTHLLSGDHTLTSCSWFSNILHQNPTGRKHLIRDK